MATWNLSEFAGFSIGYCTKCQKQNQTLRQFKGSQMCNSCWIPVWLTALNNPNNKDKLVQIQIKKNLEICGDRKGE